MNNQFDFAIKLAEGFASTMDKQAIEDANETMERLLEIYDSYEKKYGHDWRVRKLAKLSADLGLAPLMAKIAEKAPSNVFTKQANTQQPNPQQPNAWDSFWQNDVTRSLGMGGVGMLLGGLTGKPQMMAMLGLLGGAGGYFAPHLMNAFGQPPQKPKGKGFVESITDGVGQVGKSIGDVGNSAFNWVGESVTNKVENDIIKPVTDTTQRMQTRISDSWNNPWSWKTPANILANSFDGAGGAIKATLGNTPFLPGYVGHSVGGALQGAAGWLSPVEQKK